jgi:hypothetical protein
MGLALAWLGGFLRSSMGLVLSSFITLRMMKNEAGLMVRSVSRI